MGIKTGAGGMNLLERDVNRSDTNLGRISQRLSKAKKTGGGLGGLLGAVIGQILIPIPGVGAAIGGALGSWGGSQIGGATSGVSQDDILNTKFRKESAVDITKQMAQQEFSDVLKSAASGYMQSGKIGSALGAFKSGSDAGGIMSGLGRFAQSYAGFAPEGTADIAQAALEGPAPSSMRSQANVLDVVKSIGSNTDNIPASSGLSAPSNLLNMATQNFDMTEGMGSLLTEMFPGMDEEEAADSMGMELNEFMEYLQGIGK